MRVMFISIYSLDIQVGIGDIDAINLLQEVGVEYVRVLGQVTLNVTELARRVQRFHCCQASMMSNSRVPIQETHDGSMRGAQLTECTGQFPSREVG
jgi:hypothetical protein